MSSHASLRASTVSMNSMFTLACSTTFSPMPRCTRCVPVGPPSLRASPCRSTHSGVLFRGYFFSLSHFWRSFPLLPTLTKLTPSKLLLPVYPGGVLLSATMPVFLGRTWKCN